MNIEFKPRKAGQCLGCAGTVFAQGTGLVDLNAVRAMFRLADGSAIDLTFCGACSMKLFALVDRPDFLHALWHALLAGWKEQVTDASRPWLCRTVESNFVLDYRASVRWADWLDSNQVTATT